MGGEARRWELGAQLFVLGRFGMFFCCFLCFFCCFFVLGIKNLEFFKARFLEKREIVGIVVDEIGEFLGVLGF